MTGKILGAVLILVACSSMGFSVAAAHKKAERQLHQLIRSLELMHHELDYRMTPLPQLIALAQDACSGQLARFWQSLHLRLQQQEQADAAGCLKEALREHTALSEPVKRNLQLLSGSLARFDLSGQLRALESVRLSCTRDLEGLLLNRDVRLRSYRTLGICAGIALVILFI